MSPSHAELLRVCAGEDMYAVVQPLVRLSDGWIAGYEALGRVSADPQQGPAWWLEAADGAGLRVDLELAFLRAAAALGPPPGDVPLFVNASVATMLDPRFELMRDRLPPHVLELSEHDRVDDYDPLAPTLKAWLEQGTPVAIDDVGAGYANMAHVLHLRPAYLKIDRSLIAGLDIDPRRRAVVRSLHELARSCGALSVAEGIERPEELAALRDLGVDLGQGYLLARPDTTWHSGGIPATADAAEVLDLDDCKDAHVLAHRITATLATDQALLPSVYLARGGNLRCIARHGQALVIDGIEPGVGLTGTAYAQGLEIFVEDVAGDPRYRQAVPGVISEFAVPLRVGTAVVGVLNVDALRPLSAVDLGRIRRLAELLGERLFVVGSGEEHDSLLLRLGRVSRPVAMAQGLRELARTSTRAALDLTSFDTAALWTVNTDGPELAHARGADVALLDSLGEESLKALQGLVSTVASCYTGGEGGRLASGPTAILTDGGIRALMMIPLRDGRRMSGFILATRRTGGPLIPGEVVQAVELLCMQVGSRMAALQRVVDLEVRALLDPLTGIFNRSRLDELIEDPVAAVPFAGGWLAAADLDNFKDVNDFYGHAVGDEVLREVARVLQAGPPDSAAIRIGGDEFALLLPPSTRGDAIAAAEQVRRQVRDLLLPYGADLSIGLARIVNEHGVRAALAQADDALYRCKHGGQGGVTVWSPAGISLPAPRRPGTQSRRSRR